MSDNKDDGMIRFLYMNDLKTAFEYLDGLIRDSGIDPKKCQKVVIQQNDETLRGYILIGAIVVEPISLIPGDYPPAIAIGIETLTNEELDEVNAMDQVGQAKSGGEELPSPGESDFVQGSAKKKKPLLN